MDTIVLHVLTYTQSLKSARMIKKSKYLIVNKMCLFSTFCWNVLYINKVLSLSLSLSLSLVLSLSFLSSIYIPLSLSLVHSRVRANARARAREPSLSVFLSFSLQTYWISSRRRPTSSINEITWVSFVFYVCVMCAYIKGREGG